MELDRPRKPVAPWPQRTFPVIGSVELNYDASSTWPLAIKIQSYNLNSQNAVNVTSSDFAQKGHLITFVDPLLIQQTLVLVPPSPVAS